MHKYMETAMGDEQYVEVGVSENRLFAMCHQAYTKQMKDYVVSELGIY